MKTIYKRVNLCAGFLLGIQVIPTNAVNTEPRPSPHDVNVAVAGELQACKSKTIFFGMFGIATRPDSSCLQERINYFTQEANICLSEGNLGRAQFNRAVAEGLARHIPKN